MAENERVKTRREFLTMLGWAACATLARGEHAKVPESERVDLNTAALGELMKLPGITRIWAARIVKYRPYRRKDELLDRGIVPSAVYERIEERVVAHRAKQ